MPYCWQRCEILRRHLRLITPDWDTATHVKLGLARLSDRAHRENETGRSATFSFSMVSGAVRRSVCAYCITLHTGEHALRSQGGSKVAHFPVQPISPFHAGSPDCKTGPFSHLLGFCGW